MLRKMNNKLDINTPKKPYYYYTLKIDYIIFNNQFDGIIIPFDLKVS